MPWVGFWETGTTGASTGEVFVPPETSEERMSERFQPSVPRGLKAAFPWGTCGYVMLFDGAAVGVARF